MYLSTLRSHVEAMGGRLELHAVFSDADAIVSIEKLDELDEPPEGVYSIDAMADDVIELLDELQLAQPVVIGGLSMGGYVALSIVARHPERVRALMLMDTKASADAPAAAQARPQPARLLQHPRLERGEERLVVEQAEGAPEEVVSPVAVGPLEVEHDADAAT